MADVEVNDQLISSYADPVTDQHVNIFQSTWDNTIVATGDSSTRATRATAVDAAIGRAGTAGKQYVFVPEDFLDYDASAVNFTKNGFGGRLVREGQLADVYDPVAYGADPANTGAGNTSAVQAAVDAAVSAGGGRVAFSEPGTYELDEAGTNPYESGDRYCLDLGDGSSNITIALGPGVTLKLADGQQTDANGPVDMIVFQDVSGISVIGAGPSASRITGNTAGQTGWTGGYAQVDNGRLISGHATSSNGNSDIIVRGLQLDDHFSNPVFINWDGTSVLNNRIHLSDLRCLDLGEGAQIVGANDVTVDKYRMSDPSDVAAGDGLEMAHCTSVDIRGVIVETNGVGSAIDLFGSQQVTVSDFLIDGWDNGIGIQPHSDGTKCDDITVANGVVRNITGPEGLLFHAVNDDYGAVNVTNVLIVGTSSLPLQLRGGPTAEIVSFSNCRFVDNGAAPEVREDARARFVGCMFDNNGSGFLIHNTGSGGAEAEFFGCSFVNNTTNGVRVDGGGAAFSPSGSVVGCTFSNNGTDIRGANSGDLDNIFMQANDMSLDDTHRPAAGLPGRVFFNGSDGNLNIDDGTNWILPDGTTT